MTMLQIEMIEEDGVRLTYVTAHGLPYRCPSCSEVVQDTTHSCRTKQPYMPEVGRA